MILSDNETKLDFLNNQAIAKTIVSIIKESKESISIGVHGDWGAGKSSIILMVEDLLNAKEAEGEEFNQNEKDDIDWETWDETDPEGASDEEIKTPEGYLTIRFNSWQYQGFEDAKIALMSIIIKALQKKARAFYKKHPVKGAFKNLKDICKNIWKNLDKLNLAKILGTTGISLATGTTPLTLLDIASRYATDIFTNKGKRDQFISTAGVLLKNTTLETPSYKELDEFRINYSNLFKAAHVERLVVLVDDLDRCLPKVAIETLEVIRMFLVMEQTAFVIAADDKMIRYSVKEYFPRVLEKESEDVVGAIDYSHFADKYLEKLIQLPLHIPRIGIAEAQLYILMLLIESEIGKSEELNNLANVVIKKLNKPWALEPITAEEIKSALGNSYDSVTGKIKIAKSIDKFLAQNTGGNPRNIKRFVNMLLIRAAVAHNRGFNAQELEMAVLAKMMLVEQYNYDFYKAIAAELREDGSCPAFDTVSELEEKEKRTDKKSTAESKHTIKNEDKAEEEKQLEQDITPSRNPYFTQMLEQDNIKAWVEVEPSLEGKDLRPYFFACTEKEDFFFSNKEERLRELIIAVRNGKFTAASRNQQIKDLNNSDALYIFKVITSEVFKHNLNEPRAPKIIEGLRLFVKNRDELQPNLVDYLLTLPADKLGIWAVGGWDECISKSSASRPKLNEFFKKVQEQTKNSVVRNAAKTAQGY